MSKSQDERSDLSVWEIAIFFSRMWGVLETLEPLPNIGFEEVKDQAIAWAEEFLAAEEEDFVKFFLKKAKVWKPD